jgi:hypothetical protein
MWDNALTIRQATMETSRGEVPLERARARWEPGAGCAPKITPELLTERR